MKTIEITDEAYEIVEDQISCDAETHSEVILGMYDLIGALIKKNDALVRAAVTVNALSERGQEPADE